MFDQANIALFNTKNAIDKKYFSLEIYFGIIN